MIFMPRTALVVMHVFEGAALRTEQILLQVRILDQLGTTCARHFSRVWESLWKIRWTTPSALGDPEKDWICVAVL